MLARFVWYADVCCVAINRRKAASKNSRWLKLLLLPPSPSSSAGTKIFRVFLLIFATLFWILDLILFRFCFCTLCVSYANSYTIGRTHWIILFSIRCINFIALWIMHEFLVPKKNRKPTTTTHHNVWHFRHQNNTSEHTHFFQHHLREIIINFPNEKSTIKCQNMSYCDFSPDFSFTYDFVVKFEASKNDFPKCSKIHFLRAQYSMNISSIYSSSLANTCSRQIEFVERQEKVRNCVK